VCRGLFRPCQGLSPLLACSHGLRHGLLICRPCQGFSSSFSCIGDEEVIASALSGLVFVTAFPRHIPGAGCFQNYRVFFLPLSYSPQTRRICRPTSRRRRSSRQLTSKSVSLSRLSPRPGCSPGTSAMPSASVRGEMLLAERVSRGMCTDIREPRQGRKTRSPRPKPWVWNKSRQSRRDERNLYRGSLSPLPGLVSVATEFPRLVPWAINLSPLPGLTIPHSRLPLPGLGQG